MRLNSQYKVRTFFDDETRFRGKLKFKESLEINGFFEGSIESEGMLQIYSGAEVIADVKVGVLIVSGTIRGDVTVGEYLEFLEGGRIIGNIKCPNIVMAEGSVFQGRLQMLADSADPDIFKMPLERFRKTITRVS